MLSALLVILVGFSVWAFFPGTDSSVRLGLDLQGGTQIILVPTPVVDGASITDDQLSQTVEILRARVDSLGVAESEVTTAGSGDDAAIVVSVPGENQDRLVELVQQTALLDFRPVWNVLAPSPVAPVDGAAEVTAPTGIVQAAENTPEFESELNALDCLDPVNYAGGTPDNPEQWLGTCEQSGAAKYSLQPAFIKGTNVTNATAELPQGGVGWVVNLEFDTDGASALATASTDLSALPECGTGQSPCNAFAIVLDGVVVSAPRFNEPILGGQASIEGDFTAQEARDLANILKYGALPVTLDPVDITTISPTVGKDQLEAGLIAGGIGLLLVTVYLLFYYRVLGIVAALSLVVAAILLYVVFISLSKSIGLTLTLAGVAGAIVAIGITADSFIVYFERIRDEIRDGKSLRQACDTGWIRARRTLLAADFVSILAAVVLYLLSVGSVRGFAFVLGLTTLIDILIAFWFTHPVVVLLGRTKFMQRGSRWTGLDPERLGGISLADAMAGQSRRKRREGVA
ncbi:MAG: protein translocase subunit SecD [Candidatus Nanopelagicales bacterium]|nr:protein translocase subunit SecD [Candidatus Nanopelagicales bacterium]MCF8539215.1 protein translocase subunit SecD [Candidatus Nanopelagicales bacterium]MCF8551104.1 protein translocase subunit SecD [Candidatus Nanopelagicales bacterium]